MNTQRTILGAMLFIGCALVGCAQEQSGATLEAIEKANLSVSQTSGSDEGYRQAIRILSEAVNRKPHEVPLLIARANYLVATGNYKKAENDLSLAAEVGDLAPEPLMLKCMLTEKIHGLTNSAQNCYDAVVAKYEAAQESDDAAPSVNYVFAALMAKNEDSEQLRTQFLSAGSGSKLQNTIVEDFNRKNFLDASFP